MSSPIPFKKRLVSSPSFSPNLHTPNAIIHPSTQIPIHLSPKRPSCTLPHSLFLQFNLPPNHHSSTLSPPLFPQPTPTPLPPRTHFYTGQICQFKIFCIFQHKSCVLEINSREDRKTRDALFGYMSTHALNHGIIFICSCVGSDDDEGPGSVWDQGGGNLASFFNRNSVHINRIKCSLNSHLALRR